MTQNWTNDSYYLSHVGQTDLTNMENNFMVLKSLFSGIAAPITPAACQPWFDTAKDILKVRNTNDNAWVGIMHGDISQKIWIYRNSAMSGWTTVAGLEDRVIAIKGGATYATGGSPGGNWSYSHNHKWFNYTLRTAHDQTYNSGGSAISLPMAASKIIVGFRSIDYRATTGGTPISDSWTDNNSMSTYRPAAAVGTLQRLDL